MSKFPFANEVPGWLRSWCELHNCECTFSSDNADQWYIWRVPDRGFHIPRSVTCTEFMSRWGVSHD